MYMALTESESFSLNIPPASHRRVLPRVPVPLQRAEELRPRPCRGELLLSIILRYLLCGFAKQQLSSLQVSMQAKDYYVSLVDIDAGHRLRALSSKKIGKLTRITAQGGIMFDRK